MNIAKRIGLAYIKGIDASIRFIGCYVIMCFFVMVIYGFCIALTYLPFITGDAKYLTGILSIVLLPFIIRLGVTAGGLSIPPVFGKNKKNEPDKIA
jgi:hypothetical protein